MRITKTELATVAAALMLVLLVGTCGYVFIEGWSWLDGLYMTVITLATVGYGETHPLSHAGRIFTMLLIFGGLGIVAYAFSTFNALLIGGYLTDAFRRKKMERTINSFSGHYIVCGASRTGLSIAEELAKTGRAFVLVEKDDAIAKTLLEKGWLVLTGDATEDKTLKEAGLERAAGLFCCLKNDRDNAFVALTARLLNGTARIIASQNTEEVRQKLIKSGADSVINPSHIGGLRMVSEMVRPNTVTFLDLMLREAKSDYRFEDAEVKKSAVVGEIKGSQGGAALVVAVKKKGEHSFSMNPPPELHLETGDVIIALGDSEQIKILKTALDA